MRLKEDFFESDSMLALESMENGLAFSNILLKLYLRSLKDEGRLMVSRFVPYDERMIATTTRHDVETVKAALEAFRRLELIEVMDDGTIFMLEIQNFIGESSTEADRKRDYRARIDDEKSRNING
jgi:predicted phage replisome organizer